MAMARELLRWPKGCGAVPVKGVRPWGSLEGSACSCRGWGGEERDRQDSLVKIPGDKEVVVGQRRRQDGCGTSLAGARTGVLGQAGERV